MRGEAAGQGVQISVSHLLGDAGQAIEHARRINPKASPTERAARYWIDVARSYGQWGKHSDCYQALTYAAQAAPQEVRRASVHALTRDLLPHTRALPGLRAIATRTGALT